MIEEIFLKRRVITIIFDETVKQEDWTKTQNSSNWKYISGLYLRFEYRDCLKMQKKTEIWSRRKKRDQQQSEIHLRMVFMRKQGMHAGPRRSGGKQEKGKQNSPTSWWGKGSQICIWKCVLEMVTFWTDELKEPLIMVMEE